jgi:hypothetical protein
MSNVNRTRATHNHILTGTLAALAATSMIACATEDAPAAGDPAKHGPDLEMDLELVASYRVPETDAERAVDPAFAARMQAQAARAQAYLDEHVVPGFDRALRETSGVAYATLKAEVAAALQLPDPDAVRAALERFAAERRPIVEVALSRLGTTAEQLGAEIQGAALAGDAPAPIDLPVSTPLGACSRGFEFEPFPPYFQAGTFWNGTNGAALGSSASVNGAITAMASSTGGWGNGGGWVRADNVPPFGTGTTTVTTQLGFTWLQTEILLYFPAWAGSGVGVTIEVYDGGPSGPLVGQCRQSLMESWLHVGYLNQNFPRPVFHQCAFHHGPGAGFFTTKVVIDAYAMSAALIWGGFSQGYAIGNVQSVRYNTCLD